MKVVIHIPWSLEPSPIGGTERFALELAKGLSRRGHDASILCSNLNSESIIEGVKVLGVVPDRYHDAFDCYGGGTERFFRKAVVGKADGREMIRFAAFVDAQVASVDWDVLHLNGLLYSAALRPALTRHSIITSHECPSEFHHYWGADYSALKGAFASSRAIRSAGCVSTQSRYYARMFARDLRRPVRAIPPGVANVDKVMPKQRTAECHWTLLLPARLDVRQKGHDVAVIMLAELLRRGRRCTLIFSGYDERIYHRDLRLIQHLAKQLDVEEALIVRRFISMSDAFATADIVVSPERFCSYGFSIAEALAAGLPTVLSPIPTYQEIASGFSHATFADDLSPDAFVAAVEQVMDAAPTDPREAQRFRRARAFSKSVRAYESVYERLVYA